MPRRQEAATPGPQLTEDGRWIVVDGRRWRATDPSIPERLRAELVDELMDACRAVGAARRVGDADDEAVARRRVDRANVALGERGEPWWEMTDAGRRRRVAAAVLALAGHRGPQRSICPSDAARVVGGERWRMMLDVTREEVRRLAQAGDVSVTQRGQAVDPTSTWVGPVRIRTPVGEADR